MFYFFERYWRYLLQRRIPKGVWALEHFGEGMTSGIMFAVCQKLFTPDKIHWLWDNFLQIIKYMVIKKIDKKIFSERIISSFELILETAYFIYKASRKAAHLHFKLFRGSFITGEEFFRYWSDRILVLCAFFFQLVFIIY